MIIYKGTISHIFQNLQHFLTPMKRKKTRQKDPVSRHAIFPSSSSCWCHPAAGQCSHTSRGFAVWRCWCVWSGPGREGCPQTNETRPPSRLTHRESVQVDWRVSAPAARVKCGSKNPCKLIVSEMSEQKPVQVDCKWNVWARTYASWLWARCVSKNLCKFIVSEMPEWDVWGRSLYVLIGGWMCRQKEWRVCICMCLGSSKEDLYCETCCVDKVIHEEIRGLWKAGVLS